MESQETKKEYKDEEVGAFWKRTSQKGQKYLAGHLNMGNAEDESVKVVVFHNSNKQNDNQPDYRVYKSRPRTLATEAVGATEAVASTEAQQSSEDLL